MIATWCGNSITLSLQHSECLKHPNNTEVCNTSAESIHSYVHT